MSGKRSKKIRKILRKEARESSLSYVPDPRSGLCFSVGNVPTTDATAPVQAPPEVPVSPEERELIKLYRTFATTVWRMRNIVFDHVDDPTQEPEAKEELKDRSVAKLGRYIDSLYGALEDAHVKIIGDLVNKPYDENDAVKVVTTLYPEGQKRNEYQEVLTPTVRWTDKDGNVKILQQAEVVIAKVPEK